MRKIYKLYLSAGSSQWNKRTNFALVDNMPTLIDTPTFLSMLPPECSAAGNLRSRHAWSPNVWAYHNVFLTILLALFFRSERLVAHHTLDAYVVLLFDLLENTQQIRCRYIRDTASGVLYPYKPPRWDYHMQGKRGAWSATQRSRALIMCVI